MARLTVEARDVRHEDRVHPTSTLAHDFEVKSVAPAAAGCLVKMTGPRLDGSGREALSYRTATKVEVTR
jgi:hypothetical protein